jgi:hypothetical protein
MTPMVSDHLRAPHLPGQVAALARERQQMLVLAGTTAHAGEAVLEETPPTDTSGPIVEPGTAG